MNLKPTYDELLTQLNKLQLKIQVQEKNENHYERLKSALDDVSDILLMVESDGSVFSGNSSSYVNLSYGIDELKRKNIIDIDRNLNKVDWQRKWDDIKHHGIDNYHSTFVSKGGAYFHVDVVLKFHSDSNGEYCCVIAKNAGDSNRKSHLSQIRNDRLLHVQKLTKIGYWDWYADDNSLNWSREVFDIFEKDPFTFTPTMEDFEQSIHPDDLEFFIRDKESALIANNELVIEHRIITPDKGVKHVRESAKLFRDDFGNVYHIMGTVQDITEHVLNKENLENVINDQKAILDNIRAYIYFKDRDNNIIKVTESVARATGLLKCQIEGKNSKEIYPDQADKYWEDDLEVINTGIAKEGIIEPLKSIDGRTLWLMTDKIPYRDNNGSIAGVIVFANDITELVEAKNKLEESESKYKSLFDKAGLAISCWSVEGKLTSCNSKALANIKIAAPVGKTAVEIFGEEEGKNFLKRLELTRKSSIQQRFEDVLQTSNGKRTLIHTFNSIRTESDEELGIQVISTDITDQKNVEQALRESEELWRNIMINTPQLGVSLDPKGRVVFVNSQFQRSTGWKYKEVVGKDWFDTFIPESERDTLKRVFEQSVENKGSTEFSNIDNDILTRTGEKLNISWHNVVSKDLNGEVISVTSLGVDLTERRRIEEDLRQAQKMEAIGTLAGGIAHEFNNMLGVILGNAEIACSDIPEWNPASECINEIKTASLRAADVVKKLLSVARKTPAEMKPTKICPVIKETLSLIRKTTPATIDIQANLNCSEAVVLADAVEISQLLINLSNNAIHAIKDETGIIGVSVDSYEHKKETHLQPYDLDSGLYLKISISDTGEGIPKNIRSKVFDPYFTTKEVNQGLGMGLAVAKGIVQKHKGSISLTSEIGYGTKVDVYLPLTENYPLQQQSQSEGSLPTGTERILVIDDEEAIVSMNKKILERLGYRVTAETDSERALAHFRDNPDDYDLVISDMAMPQMSGTRLAQNIKQLNKEMPVIICTGYSSVIDDSNERDRYAEAYVMKPLSRKELARIVRKVLDQ